MGKNKKILEELLAKSEKRFREFFEIAPEAVIILDVSTGKFIECNTNTLVLLKFTSEEIFSKGPADISPEFQPCGRRSDEKAMEYIQRAMAGEKMVVEWQAINALGETFIAEVRLVALDDAESPLIYASVIDITDRKETERQIMDQNMRLAEIAFMQSHQMRQPIASILGLINLFNFKNPADPLNIEVMKKIKDASKLSDNILHEIVTRTQPSKNRFKNV